MFKTIKNGSGIREDPPVFSKFPHFPVYFQGASLILQIFDFVLVL